MKQDRMGSVASSSEPGAFRLDLEEALDVLSRTPRVLRGMLAGLPARLVHADEGQGTWSPYDVVGHLVHGERTDWIPRLRILLEHADAVPFEPFDRFAQKRESRGKAVEELLDDFERLRGRNLDALRRLASEGLDGGRPGLHPELGPVTLGQLLTTWVAHDLGHIRQVARAMAKAYAEGVGPWRAYLPVLDE